MKRLLNRAPLPTTRLISRAWESQPARRDGSKEWESRPARNTSRNSEHVRLVEPLASNITIDSDILGNLKLCYYKANQMNRFAKGGKTVYELLTEELMGFRVETAPIPREEEWKRHAHTVLKKATSYPEAVIKALLEGCHNIAFSNPHARRKLLDQIMSRLLEARYPVTSTIYATYLNTVLELRQDINLEQVFSDMDMLGLSLSYNSHNDKLLADAVCMFLAQQGEMQYVRECWKTFTRSRTFRGFTDKSFGIIATGHVVRGEFGELIELQERLEKYGLISLYFHKSLACALAKTGNIEILDLLLKKDKKLTQFSNYALFIPLCIELIESGHEQFLLQILPLFEGLEFSVGRRLERFTCDIISRAGYGFGADLIVHGADIFKLRNVTERNVFELETLPDIIQNMPRENMDNILIQVELRGIETQFEFNYDNISDSITSDMDRLEGEYSDDKVWLQELYNYKMDKSQ